MLDVTIAAGATFEADLPSDHNALAVVAQGRITAGGRQAKAGELVLFANDGTALELVAEESSHVIVLSGRPILEPLVQYGPFVMNTVEEIQQAIFDVEGGKFGRIPA
jgi:redox-sensitive bicupin YhaK (pirin superfamily)